MAELENLTGGILLPLRRMSTVKIRTGSLFRTSSPRIGPTGAAFNTQRLGFPTPSTTCPLPTQDVHSPPAFPACAKPARGCTVEVDQMASRTNEPVAINAPTEVCPLCAGTGWKGVQANSGNGSASNERRVTRCDCQLRARENTRLAAARIPRRYEHCELSNYDTDFPGAHPSLQEAHFLASTFAKKCDPRGDKGLLIIGKIGTGKTHLAVGIMKDLILSRGISCLFYDYRELLKEIQNSYNSTVQTTELDVLRPAFEADVLVLDELGAVKPTEWVWDTVSLILNTRYNDNRTTIITTNYPDRQERKRPGNVDSRSAEAAKYSADEETLGDRIKDRMLSRLHQMCRIITLDGADFRQKFRSAIF